MSKIVPFRGVRPRNDLADGVIAPPYDVLSEDEARSIAEAAPNSFIRVTRSEVDLPQGCDSHSKEAYLGAKERLLQFINEQVLIQDETPSYYLYVQKWKGRTQKGLMALCDTLEYDEGLIKKHELTRPDKEQDRTDHIDTLAAQTGLVFLTYRNENETVKSVIEDASQLEPAWTVTTEDQVQHSLIHISESQQVERITTAFEQLPALYIADGHHRSAAASRVAQLRKRSGTSGYFLAGIFPDDQLQVLAYNRLVKDLNGLRTEVFLAKLAEMFDIVPEHEPVPTVRGQYTVYIEGRWYGLKIKESRAEELIPQDPVGSLDVSVLQNLVLAPMLGIENPRTDNRIAFVGGIRGHQALKEAVDSGVAAVAFHLFPTGIDQLLSVADADALMPPKSTWFEPKLRGGVLVHMLDS